MRNAEQIFYSNLRCLIVLLLCIIEDSDFTPILICSSTKLAVTFLSLSAVFTPSACKGISETSNKAPIEIPLWKATENKVAVSISMAMARVARR